MKSKPARSAPRHRGAPVLVQAPEDGGEVVGDAGLARAGGAALLQVEEEPTF